MSSSPPPRIPASAMAQVRRLISVVPRAALGNLVAKLAIVMLGLVITVLVARMGPKVQGAFALFVAVESAMLTLFSGLGLWLARQMSLQAGHASWAASPMLIGVLRAAVCLGGLAALVLLAVSWQARSLPYTQLWLLALGAPFLLLVPTATGFWLGEGRMWPINLAQVAAPALVLVGLLGAGWLTTDYVARTPVVIMVLVAWVSGKAVVALSTALVALRHARLRDGAQIHPVGPGWWQDWRFVATIGVTNLVSLLNYRASLFLVERFQGLEAVGTYSVAVTVAELLWLLSSSVTVSMYARIGHPDREVAVAMTVRAVRINVLVTLIAAPVLLLGAWWALPRVLGDAYQASLLPLAALLPGVAAYAAASSLSAFYTNHLGRPHLSGAIAALSLALSFGLGWWWVPIWGAPGAAFASSVGYIGAIIAAYAVFLRHADLPLRALWTPMQGREPA